MDNAGTILIISILFIIQNLISYAPSCKNESISSYFHRSYLHNDWNHFLMNAFSFWNLALLEKELNTSRFILTTLGISILSVFSYIGMKRLLGSTECGIGFSGTLFGMITYQIGRNGFTTSNVTEIITLLIASSSQNTSQIGHISGILSGLIFLFLEKMYL